MATFDFDAFVDGYVECALWQDTVSTEDGEECGSLDDYVDPDDLTAGTLREVTDECLDFVEGNEEDLQTYVDHVGDSARAGHDFCLTRNHHGTGYWDRGYREPPEVNDALDRLTKAAHVYGEVNPFFEWEFTTEIVPEPA